MPAPLAVQVTGAGLFATFTVQVWVERVAARDARGGHSARDLDDCGQARRRGGVAHGGHLQRHYRGYRDRYCQGNGNDRGDARGAGGGHVDRQGGERGRLPGGRNRARRNSHDFRQRDGARRPGDAGARCDGKVATRLNGVQVLFNGTPAPIIYTTPNQLAAVAPYELDGLAAARFRCRRTDRRPIRCTAGYRRGAGDLHRRRFGNGSRRRADRPDRGRDHSIPDRQGQTAPPASHGTVTVVSATPPLTPAPVLPVSVMLADSPRTTPLWVRLRGSWRECCS